MKRIFLGAIVTAAVLLGSPPAWAHHAMIAEFSTAKPITVSGTVTKVMWTNPHGLIFIDVTRDDGEIESWQIETGSPFRMTRRGLKRTDFNPGVKIIVVGYAARSGEPKAAGMVVTFPDRERTGREASFTLGR